MIYNTRFVPTINGPLHLGHLYTILVNQHEAHASGGKFIIRLDDTQPVWNWKLGEQVEDFKVLLLEDLDWLGIRPDDLSSQSGLMEDTLNLADYLHYPLPEVRFSYPTGAEVIGQAHSYPYAERLTAEHVLMDYLEGVNWCIRGMDLLSEDCLYQHFVAHFG